jgi:hypothetical protein
VDMKSGVDIWWMNGINGDNAVNLILLLLLENISLSWNLETLAREYGLSYSSLFSFLGGHRSIYCFNISDTCPFFQYSISLLFFNCNFCIATSHFLQQNF